MLCLILQGCSALFLLLSPFTGQTALEISLFLTQTLHSTIPKWLFLSSYCISYPSHANDLISDYLCGYLRMDSYEEERIRGLPEWEKTARRTEIIKKQSLELELKELHHY